MPSPPAGSAVPTRTVSAVFRRDLHRPLKTIVRAEGMSLFDQDGRRYLDAVGGAGVVTIGHGVRQITEALAAAADTTSYVYSAAFTTPWQEELAARLLVLAGASAAAVYFTSGGSEANETAVKLARQYHLERGNPGKYKVVARWQSFHGVTLGTLALSGRPSWRQPFDPYLMRVPHIVPPYCYRCPFGATYPGCGVACADDLERTLLMEGPDTVAAFIAEPLIGTTVTGVTPVPEYYAKIRDICDRYDVLFIADEVLAGYGRTGLPLAMQHWGVEPDITTMGKGIGSGYAALGAVIVADGVVEPFRRGSGMFVHGYTYSGLPASCFVGLQVLDYVRDHDLFALAAVRGELLHARLAQLAARHPVIGDVRGRGLLAGVEFVADRDTREPIDPGQRYAARVAAAAEDRGVLVRPGMPGANYGKGGDHLQISPPYVISEAQIDQIVEVLDDVLTAMPVPVPPDGWSR